MITESALEIHRTATIRSTGIDLAHLEIFTSVVVSTQPPKHKEVEETRNLLFFAGRDAEFRNRTLDQTSKSLRVLPLQG
ncbi:MAG: hypothetical protein C4K49_08225 [Candidatus Thorarchaeota archaeon]|nr:MAG: hypothetical protein C4K49_08225 [Candidatus Thorarchaeota archaeon]